MAGETEKELQQLKKRFRELAEKSYMQNIYCFTGFLGMAQLDAFIRWRERFPTFRTGSLAGTKDVKDR